MEPGTCIVLRVRLLKSSVKFFEHWSNPVFVMRTLICVCDRVSVNCYVFSFFLREYYVSPDQHHSPGPGGDHRQLFGGKKSLRTRISTTTYTHLTSINVDIERPDDGNVLTT